MNKPELIEKIIEYKENEEEENEEEENDEEEEENEENDEEENTEEFSIPMRMNLLKNAFMNMQVKQLKN